MKASSQITYYSDDNSHTDMSPHECNVLINELVSLLKNSSLGQQLTISSYRLSNDETKEVPVTLHFIMTDKKHGILHNIEKTVYWIYHNGCSDSFTLHPCLGICGKVDYVALSLDDNECEFFIPAYIISRTVETETHKKKNQFSWNLKTTECF